MTHLSVQYVSAGGYVILDLVLCAVGFEPLSALMKDFRAGLS